MSTHSRNKGTHYRNTKRQDNSHASQLEIHKEVKDTQLSTYNRYTENRNKESENGQERQKRKCRKEYIKQARIREKVKWQTNK